MQSRMLLAQMFPWRGSSHFFAGSLSVCSFLSSWLRLVWHGIGPVRRPLRHVWAIVRTHDSADRLTAGLFGCPLVTPSQHEWNSQLLGEPRRKAIPRPSSSSVWRPRLGCVYPVIGLVCGLPVASEADFTVLGIEGPWLQLNSRVTSGDVAASFVYGNRISLNISAQVFDVHTNQVSSIGTILGQTISPLALPVVGTLPSVPGITPGTQTVNMPLFSTQSFGPGSYGAVTELTYDQQGNLLTRREAKNLSGLDRTTGFDYDPVFNQLTKLTDPEGQVTTIQLDATGNPLVVTNPLNG